MRKHEELTNPASCMNLAKWDEMTFVLLARDVAAPAVIRFWVSERIRLRKNNHGDPQIKEALECALAMELEAFHAHKQAGILSVPTTIPSGTHRRIWPL